MRGSRVERKGRSNLGRSEVEACPQERRRMDIVHRGIEQREIVHIVRIERRGIVHIVRIVRMGRVVLRRGDCSS